MATALKRACISAVFAAAALAASGCASSPPTAADALKASMPAAATTAVTSRFDTALKCMDALFADYGVVGLGIGVSSMTDYTGRAYTGTDQWVQMAINKMSQRSHAFAVVDFGSNFDVQIYRAFQASHPFTAPALYIRGGVTGFDDAPLVQSATGSIAGIRLDAGAGATRGYSIPSVDLQVGMTRSFTLIGRAVSENKLPLQSRSAGVQAGGIVSKLGADFQFSVASAEGIPEAVHELTNLAAIESLGRLTGVPYWTCLGSSPSLPAVAEARRDIFENMMPSDRLAFVEHRLNRLGLYSGPMRPDASPELTKAIADYAVPRGVAARSPDDFALYERLTDWKADPAPSKPVAALPEAAAAAPAEMTPAVDTLSIDLTFVGPPNVAPNKPVQIGLKANQTAFAACYLEDEKGAIAQVFPNRWQPDGVLKSGATVQVPSADAGFDILLAPADARQRLACFASRRDVVSLLPKDLRVKDLAPLPVQSLESLAETYRKTDGAVVGRVLDVSTKGRR